MTTTRKTPPPPFRWVSPTTEELQDYRDTHGGKLPHRTVRRMACQNCGKRIWGAGIAIGSHRNVCGELVVPDRSQERAELVSQIVEARMIAFNADEQARMAHAHLDNLERLLKEMDA